MLGFGQLVGAVRRGDERAFGLLWRATNPALLRYLRVVLPGGADEVAAATWRDLVRALRTFRGTEAQWRALVFATGRRHARRAAPAAAPPPSVAMQNWRLDEVVTGLTLELLAVLPPAQRDVLALRMVGRLSVAQVAKITKSRQVRVRAASRHGLARASMLVARDDTVPGPMPSESTIEKLLAGAPSAPGASSRTETIAAIIAAAGAPPTPDEGGQPGPAYAAFRAEFGAEVRSARAPLWLGSRAAAAAVAATVAVFGTLTAAYGGVLPDRLQKVAHDWLHAPAPREHGPVHRPGEDRPVTTPAHRGGAGRTSAGVPSSGHRTGAPHGAARTPPAPAKTPPGSTHTPPGSPLNPPGSTQTPPGSTQTPPGSTQTPPGSTQTPPGSTHTPPGSTQTPPGSTKTPPRSSKPRRRSTKTNAPPAGTKTKPKNRPA